MKIEHYMIAIILFVKVQAFCENIVNDDNTIPSENSIKSEGFHLNFLVGGGVITKGLQKEHPGNYS